MKMFNECGTLFATTFRVETIAIVMILKVSLNDCIMSVAMTFNVLELQWKHYNCNHCNK
jgi:hypothetical protein